MAIMWSDTYVMRNPHQLPTPPWKKVQDFPHTVDIMLYRDITSVMLRQSFACHGVDEKTVITLNRQMEFSQTHVNRQLSFSDFFFDFTLTK